MGRWKEALIKSEENEFWEQPYEVKGSLKGENMKYRDFLELTDDEIKFIINDIFHPNKISNIERDKKCKKINVCITTGFQNEEEEFEITDEVELSISGIQVDFAINTDDVIKWKQFLLAKGCNELLKNNPYL